MRLTKYLRFRIRTLLVLTAIVSGVLGWYQVKSQQAAAEEQAVEELGSLEQFGRLETLRDDQSLFCGFGVCGTVRFRWQGPNWLRREFDWNNPAFLYRADEVNLYGESFDDRIVELLARLPHLKAIDLIGTAVSPSGIERLRQVFPLATIRYEPPAPVVKAQSASIGNQ